MNSVGIGVFSAKRTAWFIVLFLGLAVAAFAQGTNSETASEEKKSDDSEAQVIEDILAEDEALLTGIGSRYDHEGRRDPFVNPLKKIRKPAEEGGEQPQCDGIECMMIEEVTLMGLAEMGGEPYAIFTGTDNKGYFVRIGDALWDGTVSNIDLPTGVVAFQQKIEDPTSAKRSREIVKSLHPEQSAQIIK